METLLNDDLSSSDESDNQSDNETGNGVNRDEFDSDS